LQAAIEAAVQAAGHAAEERPFSAHITVARAQRNATQEQLRLVGQLVQAHGAAEQIAWRVAEVVHMQSELRPGGAQYRPLRCFRLNA
jgi:2'-5' RNA ligase